VEITPVHICLIDDDEIQNFINEKIIIRFNPAVIITKYLDAQSAIDDLRAGTLNPDIIFLDINMPIMSGWDFMDIFERESLYKKTGEDIKVYILSSSKDPSDIDKMKEYNSLIDFFHKPLNHVTLQTILQPGIATT